MKGFLKTAVKLSARPNVVWPVLPFLLLLLVMPLPASGSDIATAQRHYFAGQYEQALPFFIEAVARRPDDPMRNYFLGLTHFKLEQYEAARQAFEKVVKLKPAYELARLQLARACYETGDYAWANVHLMHLRDIQTKEFQKSDFAMIQAVAEWREDFAAQSNSSPGTPTPLAPQVDRVPPEITILYPKTTRGIQTVREETGILIEGVVRDASPLMWVRINGESIAFDSSGRFSKNWFLSIGSNTLKITASDIYLNTAETSLAIDKEITAPPKMSAGNPAGLAAGAKKAPQRYAVVIGIGTYQDRKIPPLRYTVADARAMYDVLTDPRYGFSAAGNVKLLIDQEASTYKIREVFDSWLKNRVRAEDSVIVYFAGHGAPEAGRTYWVTHDADIENLYGTAISNDGLSQMLNRIASKTVIVFLDSCHSAATVNRGWHTRSLTAKDPFKEFKGEGRVVITSSNGKQLSLEIEDYGHGVFTYYLIQGLIGKADQDRDGYVILDEIWDYVKRNVNNTARQFGIHQTPIIDGRHSAGILLSKYPQE